MADTIGGMSVSHRRTSRYGWHPDLPDCRDLIYNAERPIKFPRTLSSVVDLSRHMPPIWDQGELGSCTAHGIARVLEHQQTAEGETAVTPSRLWIYYQERAIEGTIGQDSGAQIRDGIKVVASLGAPPETDWPYDVARFADAPPQTAGKDASKRRAIKYHRIVATGWGAPIRTAIASGSPIVFGFPVPQSFEDGSWDPTTDPLPFPTADQSYIGGHCVVATGYDFSRTRFPMDVIQVDNSWGSGWGDGGRFWMESAWFGPPSPLASDLWVITRTT